MKFNSKHSPGRFDIWSVFLSWNNNPRCVCLWTTCNKIHWCGIIVLIGLLNIRGQNEEYERCVCTCTRVTLCLSFRSFLSSCFRLKCCLRVISQRITLHSDLLTRKGLFQPKTWSFDKHKWVYISALRLLGIKLYFSQRAISFIYLF